MSCPYYGKSHVALRAGGFLLSQGGNECALVFTHFAPCEMEIRDETPAADVCPIAKEKYAAYSLAVLCARQAAGRTATQC